MAPAHSSSAPLGRCGRFELLERVGVGGMGEIFLGRALGAGGRQVAIKRMLPEAAKDPRFVGMFVDEARIATLLRHENIARVYEFGEHEGSHFLALEWVPGVDLRQMLDRAPGGLPLPIAARLTIGVATALEYAHNLEEEGSPLHLVHRDVSPVNLMIRFDGAIKLLDFGLAKARTQLEKTLPGYVKGKFGYLAPEQIVVGEVDPRTDVFALGLCLFEMLTGKQIFSERSAADTVIAVRGFTGPPSVALLRPEVSPELDAIVARALAPERGDRYQSAAELQQAVERALGPEGIADKAAIGDYVRGLFPERANRPSRRPPKARPSNFDDVLAALRGARRARNSRLIVVGVLAVLVGIALFVLR